jgi:aminopeptidase-like protein
LLEFKLGRRGLCPTVGGLPGRDERLAALRWVLNLADGRHDLLAMAERSRVDFVINAAARECLEAGLIEPVARAEGAPARM